MRDLLEVAHREGATDAYWHYMNGAAREAWTRLQPELVHYADCQESRELSDVVADYRQLRAEGATEWANIDENDSPARGFCAWKLWTALSNSWRKLIRQQKHASAQWQTKVTEALQSASNEGDRGEMWRISYCMNESGLRRKGRWSGAERQATPSIDKLLPYLETRERILIKKS